MLDPRWRDRAVSTHQALSWVKSGNRVFVQGAAATPLGLLDALCLQTALEAVTLYHLHLEGPCAFVEPEHVGRFFSISLFVGPRMRKPVEEGRADFMPVFLSAIPKLFTTRTVPLDVAIVQVSPPDRHADCTLGPSVDAARAAVDSARFVIAEVNERMPRTHGNSTLSLERLDAFICTDRPLPETELGPTSDVESRIGELVSALVLDGSTLQMGIGAIPEAVLARLGDKHDLGVHTEMFSDRVVWLMESGAITNKHKRVHPGRITTSFVSGTRRVFDFVDDNAKVEFHPCDRTNDTAIIKQNPKVVAINSALEVDLTGQVCADSIGHRIYSGIGGQMDFMHGAALSEGGKPIIALPSTAAQGTVSRITSSLKSGAGVVTTRGHVHWVVTEYGAVNLHGLALRERADALISIAHPDFRAELRKEAAHARSA